MRLGYTTAAAVGLMIGLLTACSSPAVVVAPPTSVGPVAGGPTAPSSVAAPPSGPVTSDPSTTSAASDTVTGPVDSTDATSEAPRVPATFTPPSDADPVDGDCPYLTAKQVGGATGQHAGPTRVRPAAPQPVCEFVRSDGGWLATVRVLQFGTDAEATAAVDFYAPISTSNPETKPAGWSGGSQPATHGEDQGTVYAVAKGSLAVIAQCNQPKSVYSRELVLATIGNLGL